MKTIEIDLADYSKDILIGLIVFSNKRNETIEETIRHILTHYVGKFYVEKNNEEPIID